MRNGKTKKEKTERDRQVGRGRGEWGIVQAKHTITQFSKKLIKIDWNFQ